METRKEDTALTADQQQLLSKFHDLLKRRDHTLILNYFIQVADFPLEHSPYGALALEADDLSAIENCISLIKEAISLETKKYAEEQIKQSFNAFKINLDNELSGGNERHPVGALNLNDLKDSAIYIQLYLINFIYVKALASCALNGKFNIKLIDNYEKALNALSNKDKEKNIHPDSGLMHTLFGVEFELKQFYISTSTECLLFETRIANKRFDEAIAIVKNENSLKLLKKAFDVCFKEKQFELIDQLFDFFFENKYSRN